MKLLLKIIFWSHLIAGLVAAAVIFLMSATGLILMYEHQLVEYAGCCAAGRRCSVKLGRASR